MARRRFLAASAGALAVGFAGCAGVTSQEFAATPVVLPESVREEYGLAPVFEDTRTTTRERTIAGQDIEATITSHFVGYQRRYAVGEVPQGTLAGRFAGAGPEATPGSGSAINIVASDLGIEEANPEFLEGDTPVSGDRITLLVPEQARGDGEVHLDELLAIHHADALPVDELTSGGGANYIVDIREAIPDRTFLPGGSGGYRPDDRWVAGHEGHWIPDDPTQLRCLVCLGERSPESVFGIEEMPGRKLAEGETVDTEDTIVFSPAPKESPTPDPGVMNPSRVFDAGYPTPIGGPTYSLGAIATPNAQMLDQSVNPLARMETTELLTDDRVKDALADAGLTDADTVEWIVNPEDVAEPEWNGLKTATVLGEEVGFELRGGVVAGEEGPWAVAIHTARVTADDLDVVLAVQRRPVGTAEGREPFGDGRGYLDRRWTTRGLELSQKVFASLETVPEGT